MRKLLVPLLLISSAFRAQSDIGISAGPNLWIQKIRYVVSNGIGVSAGVQHQFHLSQTDAILADFGIHTRVSTFDYTYLDFRYHMESQQNILTLAFIYRKYLQNSSGFFFNAGPTLGFLFAGRSKEDVQYLNGDFFFHYSSPLRNKIYSLGLTAGFGYCLPLGSKLKLAAELRTYLELIEYVVSPFSTSFYQKPQPPNPSFGLLNFTAYYNISSASKMK